MTRETQSSFSENLQHPEETHMQYSRIQGWKLSDSESQDIYIAVGKQMIERETLQLRIIWKSIMEEGLFE